jgi:hypothetical protein
VSFCFPVFKNLDLPGLLLRKECDLLKEVEQVVERLPVQA